MNINVMWDNEAQTIVRYTFTQGWNWQDLRTAMNDAGDMIKGVEHRVDVLMDLRDSNFIPRDALSQIKRGYDNPKSPNIGITVVVTPNALMSAMVSLAKKVFGDKKQWTLEFVKTIDEAYRTIEDYSKEAN